MKDYIQSNKKGLFMVAIATIIMGLLFTKDEEIPMVFEAITISSEKLEVSSEYIVKEEEKEELVLNEHIEEINFYADTFQIKREVLLEKLKEDYAKLDLENKDSLGLTLINYLFNLEATQTELFEKKTTPCTDSKEYIVSLINYFSNVYGNVDFQIATAIAEIESAFSAPTMLKKNNIFGGMTNGNLIKYKNIEYGVLRYVKLLSERYFAKGLTTIEKIGKVYNPTFTEDGVKIAKPTWVTNVNNALKKYQGLQAITSVSEIVALSEVV